MQEGSKKAVIAAFLANSGLAIAKFVGFFITGASSMLAEGVHSVADSGNQGLLLLGASRARLPQTAVHPFGYGRERYFWAFVVSLVIFLLGGVFAIYEGVHKLRDPEPISSPLVGVGILTFGVVLEGWSFFTAVKEARVQRGDQSWWSFIRTTKAAELPVILLEDLGALLGLILALLGIGLAILLGDPRFDAIGSISIGVLLTVIAALLSIEMRSLLVGESASPRVLDQIVDALSAGEHVKKVIHMRTSHLAPDELLVAAKVEFTGSLTSGELADQIDAAETRVREQVPMARFIYLEPDIHRQARSNE